jgi:selenoprotein W-related protein
MAASLAAAIKDEIGAEAELIGGGGGIFDVVVDGRMVFSKKAAGRFPEPYEVINQLKPVP